jgi:16S rRNA A1518/A1519 N6-dimethyltransferase RsmA/KsgA/DIM1 with predicted DNA glycosylase/AP lyase activity
MGISTHHNRQLFSQFYTNPWVGNLLVESIQNKTGGRILEIGSGQGSLLKPALLRWKDSKIYSTDIDPNNLQIISREIPRGKHFCLDATQFDLPHIYRLIFS